MNRARDHKAKKQHIYINEYRIEDGVLLVSTYMKTRKELEEMEDYAIIHMDEENLTAVICKAEDREAIEKEL